MGKGTDWTPEQYDNAMKYALCPVCGAPRETKYEERVENGKKIATHGIICPNGHPQN